VLAQRGHLDGLVTGGTRHDLGSAESWLEANIAYGADRYGLKWLDEVVATIKG
jgi:UTP-glucose-1-phosphate uridylyltransferase